MPTAYAHPQPYPHSHPHEERAPNLDLLLTLIFAVLVTTCASWMLKKRKKLSDSRPPLTEQTTSRRQSHRNRN